MRPTHESVHYAFAVERRYAAPRRIGAWAIVLAGFAAFGLVLVRWLAGG